jgi:hypothetical protein
MYMQGYYVEVSPYTYVYQAEGAKYQGKCLIGIIVNSADYWLVGDTFLRNYYSIYDDSNSKIGLVPHLSSNATIVAGSAPPE